MKIAFMGASGTGKSTLAAWVSQQYGLPLNPCGSRSVAKAMGFDSPYDVDRAGLRKEFQERMLFEKWTWERAHDSFVTDRTGVDQHAYAMLHLPMQGGELSLDYFNWLCEVDEAYDLIFFCPRTVYQNLDGDPARLDDLSYHRRFETGLSLGIGRFRGDLIELHKPDLAWRKAIVEIHVVDIHIDRLRP